MSIQKITNKIALAMHLGHVVSSGDVARLRRMNPRDPNLTFYKVVAGLQGELAICGVAQEYEWAAIIVGLAHLNMLPGSVAHSSLSKNPLGSALAMGGYSEQRMSQLLRGDVAWLVDHLPMLARFLVAKATPVNWGDASRLILTKSIQDLKAIRRRIAGDYYRKLAGMASVKQSKEQ